MIEDLDIEKAKERMEAGRAARDARRKKADEVTTEEPITLVSGYFDEVELKRIEKHGENDE